MSSPKSYSIFTAKQTVGIGNIIDVSDFRHKQIVLASTGLGAGDTIVVKVQGSFETVNPTFTAAKSASNLWDYIQVIDLEDGSFIDGDTGVTFATADDVKYFNINIDGLKWICLNVESISDATTSITGKIYLRNDN